MPAPLIAAAFAALAPTLAQQGLGLLSSVFSGAATAGSAKVAELIEAKTGIAIADIAENRLDEADWGKLRQFEFTNKSEILAAQLALDSNDLERQRLHNADRSDAREMQQAAMLYKDAFTQRFVLFFAAGLTFLTFMFLFYASFFHDYASRPGSEQVINTVLGFLLGVALSAIVQFFYGSSAGSKSKDDRLIMMAEEQRK